MKLIDVMAEELNIDHAFIQNIAERSNKYYKIYAIPKKNGKDSRDIFHPSPILKTFQYWLVNRLFIHFNISDYASAYNKGCSIAKNALYHLNKRHLLHLDITNFFPSITESHIEKIINKNSKIIGEKLGFTLNDDDRNLINQLVLFNGALTIGSVSSPIISNIVMFDNDLEISKIAQKYYCDYTRYADDMVFSSIHFIPSVIISEIEIILNKDSFNLNKDKVYFMGPKDRKEVTGVNVNNDRLTVGRKKRDEIKKMVYMKCKYGLGDNNKILGNLCFLKDIDPWYYNKIIIKYPNILDVLKTDS